MDKLPSDAEKNESAHYGTQDNVISENHIQNSGN